MAENAPKKDDPKAYKKAVAKARRLKKLRQMKLEDRAGDVEVSDVSDVEVVGEADEEPQDSWLNDLINSDGDSAPAKSPSIFSPRGGSNEPDNRQTFGSKLCAFTNDNSALFGFGVATLVITLIVKLRN